MKRKTASIILILAVLAFTIPHIFAASNYIEGTVRSIETNDSVENIKIDIVNCTNWSQIFNTTITGENGTFRMEYNNTWGCYLINTSGNANYIAKQFSNNSQCFENGTDQTLNIYRTDTSSLNITLKDKANSRPIPDAIIKLYPSNIPSNQIDQSKNYRCQNNICKTDANGNILLIVPNPGTYKLTIESDEYDNWNETLPKFNSYNELGKNRDYIKTLNGSGIIAGKVIDFYNSKNIEGAFVELYRHDSDPNSGENLSFSGIYNYSTLTDENGEYEIHIPPSLISSTHYDIRASHKDWTSKINYNNNLDETSGGWNSLNTNIIVRINGTLLLNGSFHDCNNIDTQLSLDIYITDKSAAGFNYHTHTDNGNFSIFIKNTTTGYDGYNITINGTQYNAETLANAQQTITHCINGSRTINGTIRDIQNNWPIENATIGITLDDGNWYETKTASGGVFEINVKNGIPYSIDIQKTGYSARMSLTDDDGIYGTINLTGATHIYGYVEDKEGEKRTAGPRIKNVTAKILNTTTLAEIYSTKTDSNGYYSLYLPSNINYTAKFEKNQYNPQESNYTEGRAPDTTTYLTGNTHIDGHILDASAFAVNKNITAGANLEFKDSESTKYILTPATGQYSIDMAIGNYNITASKQGYDTKTETGDTSGSSISKHINLKGSLNMTIYTTDDFSSQPVDLINMRLFDKSTGNLNYDNIVSLHGIINISVDSGRQYYIAVYENKYLPVYEEITPIGTVFEKEYRLKAKYETRVTDSQNGWPVENAAVQAYHYFNQTDYTYNINETILNVTVNCSGILLNDINVTITGGTHYDSKNTTSGIATFNRMPINNYTVEANGSLKGCSTGNITINIDEGGASYNTTIHLNATTFMVRVLNSICETIYPANVSYENSSGSQIVMLSFNNTYYYENHIATGNYNVSANESNHYNNTVLCNVTAPGETNYCNITLQPKPGNLSIYVYDSSLNPITGARVSITNTTASYEIATVGGWANFTDIKSSWNMTINATGVGYIFIGENNIYAYPNNETLLQRLLEDTNISVTVSDDLGLLENANVSLTDKTTGNIMQNYLGAYMTSLTDKNGTVHFTRFNRTEYNITINETSHEFYNQTYILSLEISNNFTINLDTTRVIVNVKDTYSNPIENICITLNKTDSSANFTDNTNSTGNIIFESQTFPPGQYNLTVDGTQDGYNHTTKLIDIYAGSQTTENIVLEEYRLTVQVNGSYNNHSIENATVAINTTPVSVKNTDSQGKAYFLKLEKEIYNVTINGTSIGYNYTNTITTVTGDTQTSITLKENT
ncbi:MAG: hypothetical protein U9P44_03790, partial [archaeon]|nr:hypothetical protein [archaeon]